MTSEKCHLVSFFIVITFTEKIIRFVGFLREEHFVIFLVFLILTLFLPFFLECFEHSIYRNSLTFFELYVAYLIDRPFFQALV